MTLMTMMTLMTLMTLGPLWDHSVAVAVAFSSFFVGVYLLSFSGHFLAFYRAEIYGGVTTVPVSYCANQKLSKILSVSDVQSVIFHQEKKGKSYRQIGRTK